MQTIVQAQQISKVYQKNNAVPIFLRFRIFRWRSEKASP